MSVQFTAGGVLAVVAVAVGGVVAWRTVRAAEGIGNTVAAWGEDAAKLWQGGVQAVSQVADAVAEVAPSHAADPYVPGYTTSWALGGALVPVGDPAVSGTGSTGTAGGGSWWDSIGNFFTRSSGVPSGGSAWTGGGGGVYLGNGASGSW